MVDLKSIIFLCVFVCLSKTTSLILVFHQLSVNTTCEPCCRWDTSVGGLSFADQFEQVATRLPSRHVYGLGENLHRSLRHDLWYQTWPAFSRDQPVVDAWGVRCLVFLSILNKAASSLFYFYTSKGCLVFVLFLKYNDYTLNYSPVQKLQPHNFIYL